MKMGQTLFLPEAARPDGQRSAANAAVAKEEEPGDPDGQPGQRRNGLRRAVESSRPE